VGGSTQKKGTSSVALAPPENPTSQSASVAKRAAAKRDLLTLGASKLATNAFLTLVFLGPSHTEIRLTRKASRNALCDLIDRNI